MLLPPVVSRLTANIDDFLADLEAAKAAIDEMRDTEAGRPIFIPVKIDGQEALDQLAVLEFELQGAVKGSADALRDQAEALAEKSVVATALNTKLLRMAQRETAVAVAAHEAADALRDQAEAAEKASAVTAVSAAVEDAASATTGGGGFRFWGIPLNATTLHWLIAGGAEIMAVTVPALIALGAASAAAIEGVTNIATHMESVYTATEATSQIFGETVGSLIGLKSALQQAQDAADPSIYGTLGSYLLIAKENFGDMAMQGTRTLEVFQTFSAHLVSDFAPGSPVGTAIDSFTGKMISDLSELGAVFGNLGHGIIVLAAQMPGLAEILLSILDDGTHLIAMFLDLTMSLQQMGIPLLTIVMGWEEFNRWGGLVARGLIAIGVASNASAEGLNAAWYSSTHLDAVMRTMWSIIPTIIGGLGNLASKVGAKGLGSALNDTADEIGMGISSLSTWQLALVTAGAIGVGFLIDKLVTAQSAAQKLGAAMQSTVLGVSNTDATRTIVANMAVLGGQITTTTQQANQLGQAMRNAGAIGAGPGNSRLADLGIQSAQAHVAVAQLNSDMQQQQTDLKNVNQGAQWVAQTFGGTLQGALMLADAANVKLASGITGTGISAETARAQIASLVAGYRAMGQSSGEVGADMTALAIQSGLAGTKVSQLNSAWDDFMTNLTGGTGSLGGFVESIQNMGNVVATAKNNLGEASNINLTTSQFAGALTNFGTVGAQAWQNFDQVVGSTAPQIIDWLRIAGAEGAIQAPQFRDAILGVVSSLTQFAAKSPTAQAELLGLAQQADPNIKTWAQLNAVIKSGNINFQDTANAVNQATIKMGDMSSVAANLGNVMNADLLSTLSQATIAASGVGQAMQTYEQDLMSTGTAATQTAADRKALIDDLEKLGYTAKQAAQFIDAVAGQLNQLKSKTVTITVNAVGNGLSVINNSSSGTSIRRTAGGLVGYASGSTGAASGWAWVGEAGPELVRFRGGESVIPANIARGYAAGTEDDATHEINIYLDGRQIYRSTKKNAVTTQRRTGTNGLTRRTR